MIIELKLRDLLNLIVRLIEEHIIRVINKITNCKTTGLVHYGAFYAVIAEDLRRCI